MPHKQANALFIQYAINDFNWENTFSNIDIDKRVESFNEIIPNIFSNALCSCHGTYAFQSESSLYSCLKVKKLLEQNRTNI